MKYTKRMKHEDKIKLFNMVADKDEKIKTVFSKRPTLKENTVTVYVGERELPESLDSYLAIAMGEPSLNIIGSKLLNRITKMTSRMW